MIVARKEEIIMAANRWGESVLSANELVVSRVLDRWRSHSGVDARRGYTCIRPSLSRPVPPLCWPIRPARIPPTTSHRWRQDALRHIPLPRFQAWPALASHSPRFASRAYSPDKQSARSLFSSISSGRAPFVEHRLRDCDSNRWIRLLRPLRLGRALYRGSRIWRSALLVYASVSQPLLKRDNLR